MSKLVELRLLIEKEKGNKLDKQMITEQKLLAEAEECKQKIMVEILKAELTDLQQKNEQKEKELMEIEKCKASTFRGSCSSGEQICCKCMFFIFVWYSLYVPVYLLIDMYIYPDLV